MDSPPQTVTVREEIFLYVSVLKNVKKNGKIFTEFCEILKNDREYNMSVSYNRLWILLVDRGITSY